MPNVLESVRELEFNACDATTPMSFALDCGDTMRNGPPMLLAIAKCPSAKANAVLAESDVMNMLYLFRTCSLMERAAKPPLYVQDALRLWFKGSVKLKPPRLNPKLDLPTL